MKEYKSISKEHYNHLLQEGTTFAERMEALLEYRNRQDYEREDYLTPEQATAILTAIYNEGSEGEKDGAYRWIKVHDLISAYMQREYPKRISKLQRLREKDIQATIDILLYYAAGKRLEGKEAEYLSKLEGIGVDMQTIYVFFACDFTALKVFLKEIGMEKYIFTKWVEMEREVEKENTYIVKLKKQIEKEIGKDLLYILPYKEIKPQKHLYEGVIQNFYDFTNY